MNSFKPEVTFYIVSLEPNVLETPWGLLIENKKVGFVLNAFDSPNEFTGSLPENLHLVHIWEDQWKTKKEIVKSRLKSLFGRSKRVFARNTVVVKLNKIELLDFLNQNHLNEPANGKHKYGLVTGVELIAVAVFSASCPIHRDGEVFRSHQLIRFCTKNGTTVTGGLSKLISHFIKTHNPEDIMSYADLDWSNGNSYRRLGFEEIGRLSPQPFFVDSKLMKRFYKGNHPANDDNLIQFYNQGSAKYVLDLKNRVNE